MPENVPPAPVPADSLRERLLAVMDQKHHGAYDAFAAGRLSRDQLLVHFRHEYLVYVRDFPVLVARALGEVPPLFDVRRALAENVYEEQTGGLSGTDAHPELFLRMMGELGFERAQFAEETAERLHPAAVVYRNFLRRESAASPWQVAVALLTIFVEGSVHERAELAGTRVRPTGEAAVFAHPLVRHYGCRPEAMALTRAHAAVEGGHRRDAWRIVLDHTSEPAVVDAVVATVERALSLWRAYRDGVAEAMKLSRSSASPA